MKRSKGLQAIIEARQAEMKKPENRAAAIAILRWLKDLSDEEKLSLIHYAIRSGGGIEYDLAGLLLLKPDAPYGREIEA